MVEDYTSTFAFIIYWENNPVGTLPHINISTVENIGPAQLEGLGAYKNWCETFFNKYLIRSWHKRSQQQKRCTTGWSRLQIGDQENVQAAGIPLRGGQAADGCQTWAEILPGQP